MLDHGEIIVDGRTDEVLNTSGPVQILWKNINLIEDENMKWFVSLFLSYFVLVHAVQAQATKRIEQFNNKTVAVWETLVYPSAKQKLAMHRHEHERVVIALTDGLLKITNDKGKIHYWKLEKNKAYYLSKDKENELHTDENMTDHIIKVMVVELK
jgi:beta-alanine degradation protein BauB